VLWDGGVVTVISQHPEGWQGLGYVTILALFSTVLASVIFFRLIQQTSAVFGSTVSYLVPIVAIAWGFADQETIGWAQLVAFLLILVGVFLSRGSA
ncbi:MAG: EamA family transporter, partial [Bacteroidota bacterium]